MTRKFPTLWNGEACFCWREDGRWMVAGDMDYSGEILMLVERDGDHYWCQLKGGSRLVTVDRAPDKVVKRITETALEECPCDFADAELSAATRALLDNKGD